MMVQKQQQISRLGADSERRDIIAEYGDYGSQLFAPLTKLGLYPDRCQHQYRVRTHFLRSYRGTFARSYISFISRNMAHGKIKKRKRKKTCT